MISFVLVGTSLMSVAAGLYTLAAKRLPPIFPDGQGGRTAPDIEPNAVSRWALGLIAFGIVLGAVSWLAAVYSRRS